LRNPSGIELHAQTLAMWARSFTCFMLLQLGAGVLSASHMMSSKTHVHMRSVGKLHKSLRQVDNDSVDGSALALTQSAVERVNKRPKKTDNKEELMERVAPAKAKIKKAAAATKTAKKAATSKKVQDTIVDAEEAVAEAQDTTADAEETQAAESTDSTESTESTESNESTESTESAEAS